LIHFRQPTSLQLCWHPSQTGPVSGPSFACFSLSCRKWAQSDADLDRTATSYASWDCCRMVAYSGSTMLPCHG
jgi:hypothetical protein